MRVITFGEVWLLVFTGTKRKMTDDGVTSGAAAVEMATAMEVVVPVMLSNGSKDKNKGYNDGSSNNGYGSHRE